MLKDARSVSLYPYNQSEILQYVKYTKKSNIARGFAKLSDRYCIFGQKVKEQQKQTKTRVPN